MSPHAPAPLICQSLRRTSGPERSHHQLVLQEPKLPHPQLTPIILLMSKLLFWSCFSTKLSQQKDVDEGFRAKESKTLSLTTRAPYPARGLGTSKNQAMVADRRARGQASRSPRLLSYIKPSGSLGGWLPKLMGGLTGRSQSGLDSLYPDLMSWSQTLCTLKRICPTRVGMSSDFLPWWIMETSPSTASEGLHAAQGSGTLSTQLGSALGDLDCPLWGPSQLPPTPRTPDL